MLRPTPYPGSDLTCFSPGSRICDFVFDRVVSLWFDIKQIGATAPRPGWKLSQTNVQPDSAKAHVIIYSRPGCHLCDEAKHAIEAAHCSDKYTFAEINIESDPS